MIVKSMTELIGDTPMLELDASLHGLKNIRLYAKLELLNPFGSVKDKTAWGMLRHELSAIKENSQSVIEDSSGNTAKALQLLCSMNDIPFRIVTNKIRVKEVKQILQLLGTEIEELPGQSQCLDPTDPNDPLYVVEKIMASEPGRYFHTSQYTNQNNIEAHMQMTGVEIEKDLEKVDFFFGGLGTTGSTRGTSEHLRNTSPDLKTIGIVCTKGGFLPGIRNTDEMFQVGLFEKEFYDDIVEVTVDEAIDNMLLLMRKCGVLSGPTGGSSLAGALAYLRKIDDQLTETKNAVFLVCDRVEWYLTYLQKYRPELFGQKKKVDSVRDVSATDQEQAKQLDIHEAEEWLSTDPAPLVVDLRGTLAFKGGHIKHSINIPQESFEDMCDWGIPFSRDQRILFVCPVGDQSRKFTAYFGARGFDCASLKDGFVAWRDAEKPIARGVRAKKRERALASVK